MIKIGNISGFYENLPAEQIVEEQMKEIIKKNYNLSGFTPLDTPIVERLEILTSKGANDNEIYGIHRINGENGDDSGLGLRFDLTVPLARFVAKNEGVLSFPFRRQHIARVYRGERPQKGRFREFYQADVDIIGNGNLPLFADVEIISTIYNALKELNFGDFVININNKKFLSGFLEDLKIEKIKETISIIDKKDKIKKEKLREMFLEIGNNKEQVNKIFEFIEFGENSSSEEFFGTFGQNDNNLLKEGLKELNFVYNGLLNLGISKKFIRINPSISRGLNYYTGTVFETFIVGSENLGSISSGGRYENLASNFTKNSYPGVGGSIGLTRLIAVLKSLGKIFVNRETISKVLVLNMGESTLKINLKIIENLRKSGINAEFYLEDVKIQKQLKYANIKKIPFAIICGENEQKRNVVQLKNLDTGEQKEVKEEEIVSLISNISK